jgi:hypothetical protein
VTTALQVLANLRDRATNLASWDVDFYGQCLAKVPKKASKFLWSTCEDLHSVQSEPRTSSKPPQAWNNRDRTTRRRAVVRDRGKFHFGSCDFAIKHAMALEQAQNSCAR